MKRQAGVVDAGRGRMERHREQKDATPSCTFFMQFYYNWKAKNYNPLATACAESLYSLCTFF